MQSEKISKTGFELDMKGTQLGEFEVVLLSIAMLYDDAYSVAVLETLNKYLGRPVSLGAVHRTMQRLEEKELVSSRFGEASASELGSLLF